MMEEMRKTLPTLPITERHDRSKRRATRDHSGDKVTGETSVFGGFVACLEKRARDVTMRDSSLSEVTRVPVRFMIFHTDPKQFESLTLSSLPSFAGVFLAEAQL